MPVPRLGKREGRDCDTSLLAPSQQRSGRAGRRELRTGRAGTRECPATPAANAGGGWALKPLDSFGTPKRPENPTQRTSGTSPHSRSRHSLCHLQGHRSGVQSCLFTDLTKIDFRGLELKFGDCFDLRHSGLPKKPLRLEVCYASLSLPISEHAVLLVWNTAQALVYWGPLQLLTDGYKEPSSECKMWKLNCREVMKFVCSPATFAIDVSMEPSSD
ncbi:uncharacterized protein [Castor canadensis]|uniref:Uncharacterized protein n=1 Tax=Castor canadensis TaxID=51338 RepID=A0AC58N1W6_CASCN